MQMKRKAPQRIQRKSNHVLPDGSVYVGRPSQWGNPFVAGTTATHPTHRGAVRVRDAVHAKTLFELWLSVTDVGKAMRRAAEVELRAKSLACWCELDEPCHADVLLEIANT